MGIYEPEEDSYLLKDEVEKYARGRVLDVGTGSGIQAITASQKKEVREVIAVDINSEAVFDLKKKKFSKVTALRSDLFSNVKGRFDTIIFNPPYLPIDLENPDAALDGGEEGWEILERFLREAKHRLNPGGIILLVFSNRTGKKVTKIISKAGYAAELLAKRSLPFFEELYAYKLSVSAHAEVFARGKRGLIYKKGSVCIKEKNPAAGKDSLWNEAKFLRILNKKKIGPKFISFDGKQLKRDFVEGTPLGGFLDSKESKKTAILSVLKQTLLQCREMDKLGINKTEMTNPYKDIIITPENKAVLIDFERCKKSERPQNVTQFLQYIFRKKKELSLKKIIIDRQKLIALLRNYKKCSDEKTFRAILNQINS